MNNTPLKTHSLSKSSFSAGLQCHKRLWIEKNNEELVPQPTASEQAIFDQGHEVGNWSHRLFPDGILLSGELDFETHLRASREALSVRKPLFEPAFAVPGLYARADILVPIPPSGWDLLEVKSSSNVWDDVEQTRIKAVYLWDIAFQLHVYREAGLEIRTAYLVFIDGSYVRHGEIDPNALFRHEDVTHQVEALLPSIPDLIATQSQMLQSANPPEVDIGPHCKSPYKCSLSEHCWQHVPDDSVFTLTRARDRAWRWWKAGIIRVADLPPNERYSPKQSIQITAERAQKPHFDAPAIRLFLEGLRYPLNFLDFETIMPAVPMFDNCRPFSQVPFQFSLHIQRLPEGELTHMAYLADGSGDPRLDFAQALKASLDPHGSIVTYNSPFETSRLRELADQLPEYAEWIRSILPRFAEADLLMPFRSFAAYHPAQHGKATIKAVLPAFTDLAYEDLTIREGATASSAFLQLLKGQVPARDIACLRRQLFDYCERDTLAMVKLLKELGTALAQ